MFYLLLLCLSCGVLYDAINIVVGDLWQRYWELCKTRVFIDLYYSSGEKISVPLNMYMYTYINLFVLFRFYHDSFRICGKLRLPRMRKMHREGC